MASWYITTNHPIYPQKVTADHLDFDHGALVFRDSKDGVILNAIAAGGWLCARLATDEPGQTDDKFTAATREIVQG